MPDVTVSTLLGLKQKGEKIAMLTSYDYSMARIVDAAGVDVILVGEALVFGVGSGSSVSSGVSPPSPARRLASSAFFRACSNKLMAVLRTTPGCCRSGMRTDHDLMLY